MRKIEVDEATASALEARAAEKGVTVASLVSELVERGDRSVAVPGEDLEELDRRWARVQSGPPTVPHDEVVRWLDTWGTPSFRHWRER